jgi:hypothetical protein
MMAGRALMCMQAPSLLDALVRQQDSLGFRIRGLWRHTMCFIKGTGGHCMR